MALTSPPPFPRHLESLKYNSTKNNQKRKFQSEEKRREMERSPKWKKRLPNKKPFSSLFYPISLLLLLFFILYMLLFPKDSFFIPNFSSSQIPQCETLAGLGDKYLWFAPHSGFSNQLSELKNAILMASILNRTLIVPPVLDHHAVALGSCPKFRVSTPNQLRIQVWDHILELLQSRRYVSMADIVDLSSLISSSMVKIIDFKIFTFLWCNLNTNTACLDALEAGSSLLEDLKQCGFFLSGVNGNIDGCLYTLDEDCRTTVWTYQQNVEDGVLDSFQPDDLLRKKKKVAYVRRRRDVYKALGPGSEAESATVLAFGSLFTAPYRGSELYVDIHEAPKDHRINSVLKKMDTLSFVPEIMDAGKEFAAKKIRAPFLCAQLRLLDGQFKNHWEATFRELKQKLESLGKDGSFPIHIFVMTDLPEANWTASYLGELAKKSDDYMLYSLRGEDKLVVRTAEKVALARKSLQSGFLPQNLGASKIINSCPPGVLPDILLYIEEAVCSCASLGFVGTPGSTIAESIELMRKNDICLNQDQT